MRRTNFRLLRLKGSSLMIFLGWRAEEEMETKEKARVATMWASCLLAAGGCWWLGWRLRG